ncbi:ADP-ribose pyrophosphatase, mitochondrial-like [Tubulanus polymorphus]|uniref:ADP-ribose pyrophosphatase, mitochondrial-like n=1 Tax=Tubulanus polymorphus TaxID=672921 RepID=UPI003DA2102C
MIWDVLKTHKTSNSAASNGAVEKGGAFVSATEPTPATRTIFSWCFSPRFFILWLVIAIFLLLLFHLPEKALTAVKYLNVCKVGVNVNYLVQNKSLATGAMLPWPSTHVKCRKEPYPRNDTVKRFVVPDDKVHWDVAFPEYAPIDYTSEKVISKPIPFWADPDPRIPENKDVLMKFNELDLNVDRRSHNGPYLIENGLPRNPVGRTGMIGRGLLGRWGPNHAADPIVTRWKRDVNGTVENNATSGRPILQFIAVKRGDTGEWALPGGMVDPGEMISATLKREFSEEALNSMKLSPAEKTKMEKDINAVFQTGKEVYRGYVDDPRNTDNSWMETIAVNFHDASGEGVGKLKLSAGDDAVGVRWTDASSSIKLFASHSKFITKIAEHHKAHW